MPIFNLKRVLNFTTLHNFFQRLPTNSLKEINKFIIRKNKIEPEIIVLDGTGFTNDYTDKYYAKIRKKERKGYIKNHIAIDTEFYLILNLSSTKKIQ